MTEQTAGAVPETHGHGGTVKEYLTVAVILAVITAFEIFLILPGTKAWYREHMHFIVAFVFPLLIILSVVKFAFVVGFFMHLKQDRGAPRIVFLAPLTVALLMVLVLMLFYGHFVGSEDAPHPPPPGAVEPP